MEILDALEGKDTYTLHVSQVDVDDKNEKSLNIALNNPAAQGDYEYDKLEKLFKEDKISYEDSGYSQADMLRLFGRDITIEAAAAIKNDEGKHTALEEMAKNVEAYAERRDRMLEALTNVNDQDFYGVVVFKTYGHRKLLTDALGMKENRYIDGKDLLAKLGIDITGKTDREVMKMANLEDELEPEKKGNDDETAN